MTFCRVSPLYEKGLTKYILWQKYNFDTLHVCPWDSQGWRHYCFQVVCPSGLCPSGHSCDHEISRALWEIFLKLCTNVHSDSRMNFIYFEGHRSKVKATAASCGPHLRTWNKHRSKPLTTSLDQRTFTFGGQRSVSLWTKIFWAQGF